MTKKVIFSICTAMIVVFSFGFFKVNFLDRKESKLTVTNVDLQENCIYAIAKNQLYDADDEYHNSWSIRLFERASSTIAN